MTREQLVASLAAVDATGWYADDGRYADWSARTADGGFRVEVGDEQEAVQLELSRDELGDLHRALTAALLAEKTTT